MCVRHFGGSNRRTLVKSLSIRLLVAKVIDYVSAKFTFNGVIDVESTSYLNSVSISATVNQFGTGTVQDNGVIASTTINNIITSAGCD